MYYLKGMQILKITSTINNSKNYYINSNQSKIYTKSQNNNLNPRSESIENNTSNINDNCIIFNFSEKGLELSNQNDNSTAEIIESLTELKNNITSQKGIIMESMTERGCDPKTIEERLKSIDDSIKMIDIKISNIRMEDHKNKMNVNKDSMQEQNEESSDKTNDTSSANYSNDYKNMIKSKEEQSNSDKLSIIRKETKNNLSILDKEIEMDEGRSMTGKASKCKYDTYLKITKQLSSMHLFI